MKKNLRPREDSGSDFWDFENGYYWHAPPSRIGKLLSQYELYKKITHLPGDIFELGVYKAASLSRLATFRELIENESSRNIVGFDAFGSFPRDGLSKEEDLAFIAKFEQIGGDGLSEGEVQSIFESKGFANFSLQKGDIFESLPTYLKKFPATRVALLHLDLDVKEPTLFALEHLWDRVVKGGLIMVDDFGAVSGATEAVEEFAKTRDVNIEKLTFYKVPAFFVKKNS